MGATNPLTAKVLVLLGLSVLARDLKWPRFWVLTPFAGAFVLVVTTGFDRKFGTSWANALVPFDTIASEQNQAGRSNQVGNNTLLMLSLILVGYGLLTVAIPGYPNRFC